MYIIKSKNETWNAIMEEYFSGGLFDEDSLCLLFTKEKTPFCRLGSKCVYFRREIIENPNQDDLFDLLHEIGHCKTNKDGMKRCMEEYTATQWALDNMHKYNIKISEKRILGFQDYIYSWRERGIKAKGKNMPSKKELTLVY